MLSCSYYTDCGDLDVINGQANTTGTEYGTAVEVSCDIGYIYIGDPVIVCLENGNWSDIPVCDIVGKCLR